MILLYELFYISIEMYLIIIIGILFTNSYTFLIIYYLKFIKIFIIISLILFKFNLKYFKHIIF